MHLHHIGSTAVLGIAAKPVIYILAVVTTIEAFDRAASRLELLGYEAKGEFGIRGRRYFRKDSPAGTRTHQLHAYAVGSVSIGRHLNLRDCLHAHPVEAQAYEVLKKTLAAQAVANRQAYSDGRSDFIREFERRAAASRRKTIAP